MVKELLKLAVRPCLYICFSALTLLGCKSWGKFWSWKLSGTVINLTGSGLILQSPELDDQAVAAGSTSFAFSLGVPSGSAYRVTVKNPASGQQCIIANGSGVALADVTNIVITCYASGSFDASFGTGGQKILTSIGGLATAFDAARNLVIDGADRIYVVGQSTNGVSNAVMIVCRLFSDGNLDTTFASAGSFPGCAILLSGTSSVGLGIALDTANSRIYTAGYNGGPAMLIARLTMDGVIDTGFNGTGFAQHSVGTGSHEGHAVAVDSVGRPVVVGRSNCPSPCDWFAWRFTTGGTLDTSFNGLGYIQTAGAYATAFDLLIQDDSQIVVTGALNSTMTIRRYNPNGSLDTSFNGSGSYGHPLGSYTAIAGHALVRDGLGNFIVAGSVSNGVDFGDLALWKVSAAGSIDSSFGSGGMVTHAGAGGGPTNGTDFATSLAVDAFGRILVAGLSCNSNGFGTCTTPDYSSYSIVVWRYQSNGVPDTTFNAGLHYKLVDDRIYAQNIYTTRVALKLDSSQRIVIAAGRDDDAANSADGQNLRLYRLFN
jgi:uncharacterized delta-60 repeat protein